MLKDIAEKTWCHPPPGERRWLSNTIPRRSVSAGVRHGPGESQLDPLPRTKADDEASRARLKELAARRRRFGYRLLLILLDHEGHHMNYKKLRRL